MNVLLYCDMMGDSTGRPFSLEGIPGKGKSSVDATAGMTLWVLLSNMMHVAIIANVIKIMYWL